ncbi:protein phosphatase 1, regulatory (inhibitor) subunit 13B (predicted) [Rattus norvegicus]|uniref:Protein phosphatase 1, regulatory subunit 13B n=2 Tax=Rattus norvegicus TaxID=10116 RepID=D4A6A8_RAT|nr:protein phosphatase 1, regulatory (inhibitor) subunit 13B (predicted) [Rattus norvegicus]|eukprot:NP_001101532.1 apoptosis-stimulating of p53 protein 1 [Rattus norvegicus]
MILTVFLSNNEQILTEVPITPETTCRDVVEFCKEPGEGGCHLAEVWRGSERPIPCDHMMYEHLQKWGPRREEVKFFLRHEDSPTESSEQGARQSQEQRTQRNVMNVPGEKHTENGEQRLHFLKQQERRQQQSISENEKLQKLKERVEAQENKLKKIRAMRGQVDYSKIMNGNLSAEIERFSAMFQEKKQEVQTAILRVDQLSQQLEDLKKGKLNGFQSYNGRLTGPAAVELKRLYQELQIRNQLNQEQNSKLQQQKELLNKRNMEVAMMDKRISELRERLYGKKIQAPEPCEWDIITTVTPEHIRPGRCCGSLYPGDPVKPQSLTIASSAAHGRSKSANDGNWPTLKQNSASVKSTQMAGGDWKDSGMEGTLKQGAISSQPLPLSALGATDKLGIEIGKGPPPIPGVGKPLPPSYGTYPSPGPLGPGSTSSLERRKEGSLPRPAAGPPSRQKPAPLPPAGSAPQPSSSQQIQQRISVPPSPTYPPAGPPAFPAGDGKPELPLTVAIRPFLADKGSRPQSPRKGPQTVNSSSIYSMYLQQATPPKNYQPPAHGTLNKSVKAVYGKPVLPSGSASPSPLPFLHGSLGTGTTQPQPPSECAEKEAEPEGPSVPGEGSTVESLPRPLSPTKLTPIVHSPLRYQSDADLEALRRKLANAPRPLKKRSSITEPEGPGGPNIQKLLYQRFNTLAGGMEGTPFYQPSPSQDFVGTLADVDNGNTNANGNLDESFPPRPTAPLPDELAPSSDANDNELPSPEPEELICPQTTHQTAEPTEDNNNNVATVPSTEQIPSPVAEAPSEEDQVPPAPLSPVVHPPTASASKRTNLKKPNSERTGHGLRVRFNPLALLLDASLEGEFDLVQRIIYEVEDPSKPNDEGITPLHNAVCAGHHHIVKFLLDFGVNVNAADSDGWTPLHCAASCNSVHLCKQLVESGAAIFASTISDIETAADKCEEMEEGYIQCSQFLYGVQEKLGVMNKGIVYALWDYEAQNNDELSFHEGDAITILRRKDENETEWWWARLGDREGYVPKNLLGLYPRIKPRQRTLA